MGDSKSYEAYLNYHDYDKYKFYFNAPWITTFNEEEYQKSLDLLKVDKTVKEKHSEAFRLLFKHLHNSNVFSSMDVPTACKYISYALRKKVYREKQQEYNDSTFDIFKRFLIKYKKGKDITSDHCENSLVLIDPEIFEEMHNLYTLYEKYSLFAPTGTYRKPSSDCRELEKFAILYNAFIKDQKLINKSLYDVLKNFEPRVNKTITDYKHYCTDQYLTMSPLKADYLPKDVKSNMNAPEKQQPIELPTAESRPRTLEQSRLPDSSSQISNDRTSLHTQPKMNEDREAVRLGDPQKSLEYQEVEVPEVAEEVRGTENVYRGGHGTEDVYRASRSPPMRRSSGYPGDITIPETLKHTRLTDNSLDTQKTESPIEDRGFITNIQGAFSSIAEHVEPAPILGVSGGMGVLFLLFKYTPVGSFFGGRRGRFRQIPRTFGGFPPGDFANFQEYGGGYVGYSQMDMPFQGE
ncbi:unnamed protein product [Plasmodium vivax]|uniref:(malaria parasite P. vivax) hypothetical protein n=1 Tax=Plasmodium vivax TaxID=5855 RepID=A0A8S4HHC2_PLAVI|nr:unnamed protein product [Plasmodium vivax]